MQRRFWQYIKPAHLVVGLALAAAGVALAPYMAMSAAVARYTQLVAQSGGRMEVRAYSPSLSVAVSFVVDDEKTFHPRQPVLRELRSWGAVTELSIERIEDDELEAILAFPNLTALSISGTFVSDETWSKLGQLLQLRSLFLAHAGMSATLSDAIGRLVNLETLYFTGCEIPTDGVRFVAGLRRLRQLQFFQNSPRRSLTTSDLEMLAALPELTLLRIVQTPLESGGLAVLGRRACSNIWMSAAPQSMPTILRRSPNFRLCILSC